MTGVQTCALPISFQLPASAEVRSFDLFGNPVAAGAAIDDRVHYVECDVGLPGLKAALGVKTSDTTGGKT